MRFRSYLSLFLFAFTAMAFSQQPGCKEPDKNTAEGQRITCAQYFELESIQMKITMLQTQAGPLFSRKADIIKHLEAVNPGYHWAVNQQTGQDIGLVKSQGPAQKPPIASPVPSPAPDSPNTPN